MCLECVCVQSEKGNIHTCGHRNMVPQLACGVQVRAWLLVSVFSFHLDETRSPLLFASIRLFYIAIGVPGSHTCAAHQVRLHTFWWPNSASVTYTAYLSADLITRTNLLQRLQDTVSLQKWDWLKITGHRNILGRKSTRLKRQNYSYLRYFAFNENPVFVHYYECL